MKHFLLMFLMGWLSSVARADEMRVVATVPNAGMLARAIGGDAVSVRVLAPPNRDAHYLEARPSMMAAMRRADLLIAVGADLEIGWIPAALRGANNARIQAGRPGYFELATTVELIDVELPLNRAFGDVHPHGNPHLYLDPERLAKAGHALAERMGKLVPDRAGYFVANAIAFDEKVQERMAVWRAQVVGASGVLTYHSDFEYLLQTLGIPEHGKIEPLPGIPPTAAHLRQLVQDLRGKDGVIWTMDYQPDRAGVFMAGELNWRAVQLPGQVSMDGTVEDYFRMLEAWLATLSDS